MATVDLAWKEPGPLAQRSHNTSHSAQLLLTNAGMENTKVSLHITKKLSLIISNLIKTIICYLAQVLHTCTRPNLSQMILHRVQTIRLQAPTIAQTLMNIVKIAKMKFLMLLFSFPVLSNTLTSSLNAPPHGYTIGTAHLAWRLPG